VDTILPFNTVSYDLFQDSAKSRSPHSCGFQGGENQQPAKAPDFAGGYLLGFFLIESRGWS
jgi:hypothetical protein